MKDLSKLVIERQQEEEKKKQEAERDRVNALINKFYDWMESEGVTVRDARQILKGTYEMLEQSILSNLAPHREAELNRTMKEFYAEVRGKEKSA